MKPIRFLTIKDVHLRDKSPQSRIDDYAEEVFDKLNQIKLLAEKLEVDAVINAGDLFHFKAPTKNSHELVQRTLNVFKSFPCPIIGILGNHDIQYDMTQNVHKQPIGTVLSSGAMKLLGKEEGQTMKISHIVERDGVKVVVTGQSWDRDHNIRNLISHEKGDEDFLIAVVHALLDPVGGTFYGHDNTKYDQCVAMEADVAVCGHLHVDHGVQQVQDKYFVNHGALSRGSLHEDNITRRLNTCLIQVDKDNSGKAQISFKLINLRTEPADEIFDLERHAAKKEESALMEDFISTLQSQDLTLDIRDIAGSIESVKGFEDEVRQKAIHYWTVATSPDEAGES